MKWYVTVTYEVTWNSLLEVTCNWKVYYIFKLPFIIITYFLFFSVDPEKTRENTFLLYINFAFEFFSNVPKILYLNFSTGNGPSFRIIQTSKMCFINIWIKTPFSEKIVMPDWQIVVYLLLFDQAANKQICWLVFIKLISLLQNSILFKLSYEVRRSSLQWNVYKILQEVFGIFG